MWHVHGQGNRTATATETATEHGERVITFRNSLRSRWLAPSSAIALGAGCRLLGCATSVEEPPASVDQASASGLVSSSASGTSTHGTSATISSTITTSASTTSSVTTGGSTATTAESSGATGSESSTVANAAASNDTTSSTSAVTTGGGSTTSTSGTAVTGGAGGATASISVSSAAESNATTGGSSEFCDDAQTPAQNAAAEGNTGSFGTTDGVCYRLEFVPADFAGWGCSNFGSGAGNRTIVVNGTSVICGELPLPAPVAEGYYFDFGPGTNAAATMYWWNWQ